MIQIILALLFSAPLMNLSKRDVKEFSAAFSTLEEAHKQGRQDIVVKYGEDVLDRYDLIQVSLPASAPERIAYDSLASWVKRGKESRILLNAIANPLASFGEKLSAIASSERMLQADLSKSAKAELSAALAQSLKGMISYPVDSLWLASQIISSERFTSSGLQKRLIEMLDEEFTNAQNGGSASLIEYSTRFQGYRTDEIQSHLDFNAIDEMNVALRSNQPQDLIPIYKNLPPGKQKKALRTKIEKIMYVRWQRARVLDEEIKAAKDFIEVFKDEKDRTKRYAEVELWLFYNINPTQPSPTPVPDGALPQAPGPIPPSVTSSDSSLSSPSLEAAMANGPAYIPPTPDTTPEPRLLPKDRGRRGVKVGY